MGRIAQLLAYCPQRVLCVPLSISKKQPLQRLTIFATDPKQDLNPDFFFSTLHRRYIPLTDPNPLRKFFLIYIKSSKFADTSANGSPLYRSLLLPAVLS